MKIIQVIGRELFDAQGQPTIGCELILDNGFSVAAVAPTPTTFPRKAHMLYDGGERLRGRGVLQAMKHLETKIAPLLIGKEPNLLEADGAMIALDGTVNKSHLGANTMFAVSLAIARAQALMEGLELFELIAFFSGSATVTIPLPLVQVARWGAIECMMVPVEAHNVRHALEIIATVVQELEKNTQPFADEKHMLDRVMAAFEKTNQRDCILALDSNAHTTYNAKARTYRWDEQTLSSHDLMGRYHQLIEQYPIYSLTDGFALDDAAGWQGLTERYADSVQIVGDALGIPHYDDIRTLVEQGLVTAVAVQPAHIGTLTETISFIKACKNLYLNTILTHHLGATEDTFMVDLALGTNAGQIRAGDFSRGEHVAHYNRLLSLEDKFLRTIAVDLEER